MSFWFFGGSREMPDEAQATADHLVRHLLCGLRFGVVCDCTGADEMFVRSFVRFGAGPRLTLHAVAWGPSPSPGLPGVVRAAGGQVVRGPFVRGLAGALAARSRAAAAGASGASLLLSRPDSFGSLNVVGQLLKKEVSVYAYCFFDGPPEGKWSFCGQWWGASVWVPAAVQPRLF